MEVRTVLKGEQPTLTTMIASLTIVSSISVKASLLTIPAEVRNMIYELALIGNKDVNIDTADNRRKPGLLNACKPAKQETTKMYYSRNNFLLTTTDNAYSKLEGFLKSLSLVECRTITEFIIEYCISATFERKLAPLLSARHAANGSAYMHAIQRTMDDAHEEVTKFRDLLRPLISASINLQKVHFVATELPSASGVAAESVRMFRAGFVDMTVEELERHRHVAIELCKGCWKGGAVGAWPDD